MPSRSARPRASPGPWRALLLQLQLLLLPVWALSQPASAPLQTTRPLPASHCLADESVQFSCQIGAKTVSLCASGPAAAIQSLSYRFGLLGRVENTFVARPDNNQRFHGTVAPAGPGASVNQVWFDRDKLRLLLTECIGGNCPKGTGLAVPSPDRVLMNAACARSADNNLAWFSRGLVQFGSDANSSRSTTDLLRIEDDDNEVNRLYRTRASP